MLLLSSSMLLLLGVAPVQAAGKPAYYHPDDVAGASERFGQAATAVGPAFEKAQTELARLGRALESLEQGMALLGEQAPAALATWAETTRRTVSVQYLQTQRHVDLLQDDYANVFSAALERAITTVGKGYTLKECAPTSGSSVTSLMRAGGGRASVQCEGEDLNARITEAVDRDAVLAANLDEINGIEWPSIGISPAPQPAAPLLGTAGPRYVQIDVLAERYFAARLDTHRERYEDAIAPLEEDIDSGAADAIQQAAGHREAYLRALASDGATLTAALQASLGKAAKKDASLRDLGLCANPAALGGCAGEDATEAVVRALQADKKFSKAMEKLR